MPRPTGPAKKMTAIRIDPAKWEKAKQVAEERGEYASEAIDRFLALYAEGNDPTTTGQSDQESRGA